MLGEGAEATHRRAHGTTNTSTCTPTARGTRTPMGTNMATGTTTARAAARPRPSPRAHRRAGARGAGAGEERRARRAQPGVVRGARDPGPEPARLAGRRQDHAARAHHRGAGRRPAAVHRRGRSGDGQRRRAHPQGRRAGGADQHRHRLPPRGRHGGPRPATQLRPPAGALVVIENVGNLVCPALFDLGERRRWRCSR